MYFNEFTSLFRDSIYVKFYNFTNFTNYNFYIFIIKNYNFYIVTKERIIICTIIAQVIWYIYTPMNF